MAAPRDRGRDHGRGQKNAGETISFTLLNLTSFSTGHGSVSLPSMKNDELCHNYAKGC